MQVTTILFISVIALVVLVVNFFILWDRQRARWENVRARMRQYVIKARRDRNYFARIPAHLLNGWFKLDERTLPDPREFTSKPGPHPARKK